MCTNVELGDSAEIFIRVTPEDERLSFLCEFAKRCFRAGRFRSRTGATNKWLLDCREGLGDGAAVRAITTELIRVADARGVSQFVGAGFGAFVLVGAILGVKGGGARGAVVRSEKKKYGCRRLIEGAIAPDQPICIVDDILNSGRSALRVNRLLRREGFQRVDHLCIFRFAWGNGIERLKREGVDSAWLATVTKAKREPSGVVVRNAPVADRWCPWRWLRRNPS